ncbi:MULTISPECIES: heme exporter protein CcmD [unclassified Neorhizobium]|uniref:heme exporter protein CcmD n=1 Tax=unclassified Neorhizobium TaxID=2629175 RepID=UPI001FF3C2C1|nr:MULTISPECIES: heme exporter protein CcmD [unclassified Neorhizobium]MCJ9674180.1 heme exporter protein CcmD [Neorhizobium sp. SHOUNA12B]MCJ9746403.1 heme exporter protein CcmD [Neorhizobium sp. SHOUNA12A]
MSHTFYIAMSYAVSAIVILCLIGWTWLDGRARRQELAELEASGIRRRSAQAKDDAA